MASPSSATRRRAYAESGASGSSLISEPGTTGRNSSSSVVRARSRRVFAWPAQAEQDEVVLREDGVDHLRHDGVVVADDAGEERHLRRAACASRFWRTSACTERRGTAPAATARRNSPSVDGSIGSIVSCGFKASGRPSRGAQQRAGAAMTPRRDETIPAVHPSRVLPGSTVSARWCWPTAAVPGCVPRTRWRPSSTAPRAASTASNSTSASPATARSSSSTTTRWTGPPTRRGRCPRSPPTSWRGSMPRRSSSWRTGAPFRGRGIGIPRLRDVLRRFPQLAYVIELKGEDPAMAGAAVRRRAGVRRARPDLLRGIQRRRRARGASRRPQRNHQCRDGGDPLGALSRLGGTSPSRPAVSWVPGARAVRADDGRDAAVRARDASRRPLRAGVDREHRRTTSIVCWTGACRASSPTSPTWRSAPWASGTRHAAVRRRRHASSRRAAGATSSPVPRSAAAASPAPGGRPRIRSSRRGPRSAACRSVPTRRERPDGDRRCRGCRRRTGTWR